MVEGKSFWRGLLKEPRIKRVGAALFLFLCLTLLAAFQFFPEGTDLEVGQVAPRTIKAPRAAVFEDKVRTEELRREAQARVPKVYDIDPKVLESIRKDMRDSIEAVIAAAKSPAQGEAARVALVKSSLPFPISDDLAQALLNLPESRLRQLGSYLDTLVTQVMVKGVKQEDLQATKEQLRERIKLLALDPVEERFAQLIIQHTLRPNSFYNPVQTEILQQQAREAVPPVVVTIRPGEKIIGEGEVVTPEHIAKLKAVGLYHSRPSFGTVVGIALMMALLTFAFFYYIYQQHPNVYRDANQLYLISFVVVGVLLLAKFILAVDVQQWPSLGSKLGYAVPVAVVGMLLAVLINSRLAVVAVALTALLVGMLADNQLRFALAGMLTGLAGVYGVAKLHRRRDLVRAGMLTGLTGVGVTWGIELASQTPLAILGPAGLALGILNGLLSTILTNGALPVLEHLGGITSPVRLLELTSPSEPLLKRLAWEAPGTYHHSVMVANLGEAAAEAIGADILTVRAGAYYHDIGKLRRPSFFAENLLGSENPHDRLAPSLSTLIITSHVKDGVEIAREYKLPEKIIEIIEQHHGTSLVSCFYQKALQAEQKGIQEADFRYPGPKPQTREAAIVMLADSVEAAVRSMNHPPPGQIEGLVRRIIKEKLHDGQLDECALTFRDLELIAHAFVHVLTGLFHTRVEYPRVENGKGAMSYDGDSPESAREGEGRERVAVSRQAGG
ncbi:HD family phosphohydrolase [Ammonifex degensii]|uniref:HD family phosphohydrolase n=1 Tax=Ammonifex degensii TaxID=42838 RepID=UPI00145C84CB|nr:HDIG domain-containing metalloprotein [Ammonifex degensii]